jgi:hypothetical protein
MLYFPSAFIGVYRRLALFPQPVRKPGARVPWLSVLLHLVIEVFDDIVVPAALDIFL